MLFLGNQVQHQEEPSSKDNESFKTHMTVNLYYINQKQVHRKLIKI